MLLLYTLAQPKPDEINVTINVTRLGVKHTCAVSLATCTLEYISMHFDCIFIPSLHLQGVKQAVTLVAIILVIVVVVEWRKCRKWWKSEYSGFQLRRLIRARFFILAMHTNHTYSSYWASAAQWRWHYCVHTAPARWACTWLHGRRCTCSNYN